MRTVEEIKGRLGYLRKKFNNLCVTQDYTEQRDRIKEEYRTLEWVLGTKYCIVCGAEHSHQLLVCTIECSKKVYG